MLPSTTLSLSKKSSSYFSSSAASNSSSSYSSPSYSLAVNASSYEDAFESALRMVMFVPPSPFSVPSVVLSNCFLRVFTFL